MRLRLPISLVFCLCCLSYFPEVWAQKQLKTEGGIDSTRISTRLIDGKITARILIESGIKLSYSTNMEIQLSPKQTGHFQSKGRYCDTLYFFPTSHDNVRMIYLEAEGYFTQKIGPLKLLPKTTFRYVVYDPLQQKRNPGLITYNIFMGGVLCTEYPSYGLRGGGSLNLRICKFLAIVPEICYNRLYLHPTSSPSLCRVFLETNFYLKYRLFKFANIYGGYSQTFIDYNGYGLSLVGECKIYKKLQARFHYNHYFNFDNSLLGIALGVTL